MKAQGVYATEANVVELKEFDLDEAALEADQLLLQTRYSLISPGTELDCVSGVESSWFHFPQQLGYCGVGQVVAVGPEVSDYSVGDTVLVGTGHGSHAIISESSVRGKLPPGVDPKEAALAHIALISITALRASSAELGDAVAVIGQGLIGNMAAQLFRAQGCRVIALDRLASRLETAKQCGTETVVDASAGDPAAAVKELTDGRGAEVVVEASGSAAAALQGPSFASRNGEMILLGTPRGSHEADVGPLLRAVHRASPNLTLKGAHGGSLPSTPDRHVKHSVARNARIILEMLRRGELVVKPLISRVVKPEQAADAYRLLRDEPENVMGVIFDWTG